MILQNEKLHVLTLTLTEYGPCLILHMHSSISALSTLLELSL